MFRPDTGSRTARQRMSEYVVCSGCSRRVHLPDSINTRRARCPKCRQKLFPAEAPAIAERVPAGVPPTPAASPPPAAVLSEFSLDRLLAPESEPEPEPGPPREPEPEHVEALELDDDPDEHPAPTRVHHTATTPAPPVPRAPALPPPPCRFRATVVSDSCNLIWGTFAAVATPQGLSLESAPNRSALLLPPGATAVAVGTALTVVLGGRAVVLRLRGVGNPHRLAADTAAFLTRQGPVPLAGNYRRPWWLLVFAIGLALALAAGPIMMTHVFDLNTNLGLGLGAALVGAAVLVNAGIVLFTRLPAFGKVAIMGLVCLALMAVFLGGTIVYIAWQKRQAGAVATHPTPVESPPGVQRGPGPPEPKTPDPKSLDPKPPEPGGAPPSHIDIAYASGVSQLDPGPTEVTALALAPGGSTVVGYADGSTRIFALDQSIFDAPLLGPRGSGPVRRIEFDTGGKIAYLSCPDGVVVASLENPPREPVKVRGELIAVAADPRLGDRFAAVRDSRIVVRYVPLSLAKNPSTLKATNGFVIPPPKFESPVIGSRSDFPLPGPKPTFLAWHSSGRLLAGQPDGTVMAWLPRPRPELMARQHTDAVRAWASSGWKDFATGDDKGNVGYWPGGAIAPTTMVTSGTAPITCLAFSHWGAELAVADAAGGLSVWDMVSHKRLVDIRRRAPVKAVAFGTWDDLLVVADGKAVEVWHIPELARRGEMQP